LGITLFSRRYFLVGMAARFAALRCFARGLDMETISFDEQLHASFRHGWGTNLPTLLALAECAGLAGQAREWIREHMRSQPDGKVVFGWFGKRSLDEVMSFWRTLRDGTAGDIIAAARALTAGMPESTVSLAFDGFVDPLVLLGRSGVLVTLYAEASEASYAIAAEFAPLTLAQANEWDHALALLAWAHRGGRSPHFSGSIESLLWKFAYLQRHVEMVLPALEGVPFNRQLAHMAEARKWKLVTYQIRAGSDEVLVPVIEDDDKPAGYIEAAATQIAALEDIPSAAELCSDLRRVLKPRTVTMQHADLGWAITLSSMPYELFKARVRIAASRKDYAKAAALAESPSHNPLVFPADEVIDAFIEEGEWRAAADIAALYDPRERPVVEPFDDTRNQEYLRLQEIFAAAAARSGDDAAAARFLANCVANYVPDVPDPEAKEEQVHDGAEAYRWLALLLAGAVEGRVPRHFLAVLLPVFRRAF
jgi:hypothetical protein